MLPNKDQLAKKIAEKCAVPPKIRLKDYAQPLSDKFVGKKFELTYEDDNGDVEDILAIEFKDEYTMQWWGVEGPLKGHSQSEAYVLFEIAENIYYLTWYEQAAPAVHGERWGNAGYLIGIIVDLNTMSATDSYTNPPLNGKSGTQFILAQCRVKEIE